MPLINCVLVDGEIKLNISVHCQKCQAWTAYSIDELPEDIKEELRTLLEVK